MGPFFINSKGNIAYSSRESGEALSFIDRTPLILNEEAETPEQTYPHLEEQDARPEDDESGSWGS